MLLDELDKLTQSVGVRPSLLLLCFLSLLGILFFTVYSCTTTVLSRTEYPFPPIVREVKQNQSEKAAIEELLQGVEGCLKSKFKRSPSADYEHLTIYMSVSIPGVEGSNSVRTISVNVEFLLGSIPSTALPKMISIIPKVMTDSSLYLSDLKLRVVESSSSNEKSSFQEEVRTCLYPSRI